MSEVITECRDCVGFQNDETDRFFCGEEMGHEGKHKWIGISDIQTNKEVVIEWQYVK